MLGCGALVTQRAEAQEGGAALAQLQEAISSAIAKAEPSVVSIRRYAAAPERQAVRVGNQNVPNPALPVNRLRFPGFATNPAAIGHGAGVVIGPDTVLTQYLSIGVKDRHTVSTVEGDSYPAEVIAADPRSSLAVLRVTGDSTSGDKPFRAPSIRIGKAEDAAKGRFVVAIGNPYAIESDGQPTTSWGIITNTSRRAPINERMLSAEQEAGEPFRTTLSHFGALIQTDARLGWNSAGGALVTLDGALVGILTTTAAIPGHESPAGYAIPMNRAMRRIVKTLSEGKEPEYGLLGIRFEASSPRGRTGVLVSDVYAAGPAGTSGLVKGDLITQVNGNAVYDALSLQLHVGSLAPSDEAVVTYERRGSQQETTVRLGKAYIEGPKIATNQRPAWQGLRVDYPTAVPPTTLQERVAGGHLDPEGCVVVSDVERDSVAWNMGIRPYVYVSHVSDERVSTPAEFYAAVDNSAGKARLKFTKPLPNTQTPASPPRTRRR